jgi:alanyl-tRNA synthetase
MGGQVADHGVITADGVRFEVTDVQKNKGGKYLHYGRLTEGILHVGDIVNAAIDVERRKAIMRAHSATHLLDKALRTVLGEHVHQAGSLVEPDRVRFDFTHFSAMTPDELSLVEAMVNDAVLEGYEISTEELPIEEAKKRGAIALFGEKYGDVVRVVDMGGGYSVEFCGGTHLDNTAKVGVFRIVSEFSVASGVRRIEAITGKATLEAMGRYRKILNDLAGALKTKPDELFERTESLLGESRELRRELEKMKDRVLAGEVDHFLLSGNTVGGLRVITAARQDMEVADLRKLGDFIRDREAAVVALLASVSDGKITLLAVCGKEAVARGVRAGDIIKSIAPIVGGKGGGKPDSAMGGGTDVLKLDDALAALDDFVADKLDNR